MNYKIVDKYSSILRADFNQADSIFPIQSRGTQCTAMCAYAIVYSHIDYLSNWSKHTLNRVLILGDKFYDTCQIKLRLKKIAFNRQLTIDEIFEPIEIENNIFRINYQNNDILKSSRVGKTIRKELDTIFYEFLNSDCFHAIFIANQSSYAIFKDKANLILFDSHSKNQNGIPTDIISGTSNVMIFYSPFSHFKLSQYFER